MSIALYAGYRICLVWPTSLKFKIDVTAVVSLAQPETPTPFTPPHSLV
jgi:hypothetical protein